MTSYISHILCKNQRLFILALLGFAMSFLVACDNLDGECDPEFDEGCTCTSEEENGNECDPEDLDGPEDCTCLLDDETNTNTDPNLDTTTYAYVMIEDTSTDNLDGDTPGSDVDAISIIVDGNETFAQSIEASNIGGGSNGYSDPNQVLGPVSNSNSNDCDKIGFVSLGGPSSYVIVGFAGATFSSGDQIKVYELSAKMCSNHPEWLDDSYNVQVSASSDRDTFVDIGKSGQGIATLTVP